MPWLPAALLGGSFGTGLLVWTLTQPSAMSIDAWSYEAWGDSLLRGEAPLYDHARTTPKPLGTILGAAVDLLPPDRGMAVPVAAGLALLVASLFVAGFRLGGAVAAIGAILALAITAPLARVTTFALIDGVSAGLVALAIALGGWGGAAALMLAGLLRPEAWPLVGVATYLAMHGKRATRLGTAVLSALVPVGLWAGADYIFAGDALASKRIGEELGSNVVPWTTLPSWISSGLGPKFIVVAALGCAGLVLHVRKRRATADAGAILALAVILVWPAMVAYETHQGLKQVTLARYFLPVTGVLALGCGLLASTLVQRLWRNRAAWPAAAFAGLPLAFVAVQMALGGFGAAEARRIQAVRETVPALERAFRCGRIGIAGSERGIALLPQLALLSARPLGDFEFRVPGRAYAAVLRIDLLRHRRGLRQASLPPWPRVSTPAGPLAIAPDCAEALR